MEAASELIICCKKAFAAPDLLESSSGDDNDLSDEGAPELMDVLVDTLLSLLPQSSAPMRSAIEQVHAAFDSLICTTIFGMFLVLILDKFWLYQRHKICK